MKSEFIALDKA